MRRLGWSAHGAFDWSDALGDPIPMQDFGRIRDLIHRDFRKKEWKAIAARREDFDGCAHGVDEETTGLEVRSLLRRGCDKLAAGLLCVLAGGTWPQARRFRAGFVTDPVCPRCGAQEETVVHRWWLCPALDASRRKYGVADLAHQGERCGFQPACFWNLGVVPSHTAKVAPSAPMLADDLAIDPSIADLPSRDEPVQVFTDGAATHPTVPQLRRAGWGLWVPGCPDACAQEPLCGQVQTAQRAELRAFVAALERTGGNAVVWSDSRYVVRGASRIAMGACLPRSHGDLWERARQSWLLGTTQVHWIKAHLDWQSAQQRGFPWRAWAGNQRADELAGLGAAAHAPASSDVDRVLKMRYDVRRTHRWMAAALSLAADHGPPVSTHQRRTRQRGAVDRLAARGGPRGPPGDHPDVQDDGDYWRCGACHRRVKKTRGWRVWRRIPCRPVRRPFPREGPAALPADLPAGRVAHFLHTEDGRTACVRCGQSRLTRWRSKLGVLCPAVPAVPAAAF